MIIFAAILSVICLLSMKKRQDPKQILSPNDTGTVNGIFTILVFLSHCCQYLDPSGENVLDKLYTHYFKAVHDQWIVTTFLCFSGYGVMYGIVNKSNYIRYFFKNRIIKTLVHFDIAVLAFCLLNLLLEIRYSWNEIVFSFIGLTSVGNSNWYMLSVLIMYLFTYLISRISVVPKEIAAMTSILSLLYIATAHIVGLASWFVNTVLCYPLGMWIFIYRDSIIKLIRSKPLLSALTFLLPIIATYRFRSNDYVMNLSSCFFVMLWCYILCFAEFHSKILTFLGKHTFSIYILQRLPMILFSKSVDIKTIPAGKYLFVIASFVITVCLAIMFDKLIKRLDKKMFAAIE